MQENQKSCAHFTSPCTAPMFLPSLFIMIGLLGAGYFVKQGSEQFRTADRSVSVKGLSEKIVDADTATLSIGLKAAHDELSQAYQMIEKDRATILAFLAKNGIKEEQVEPGTINVTDLLARTYGDPKPDHLPRYIIEAYMTIRTNNVMAIQTISGKMGDVVKLGIVLAGSPSPEYFYTRINEIKPEMIAEATKNARISAEKFAMDSGSKVGGIRRANQGFLTIRDANDQYSETASVQKKVRIVSTIEYDLKN